jgi:hypothetical protein
MLRHHRIHLPLLAPQSAGRTLGLARDSCQVYFLEVMAQPAPSIMVDLGSCVRAAHLWYAKTFSVLTVNYVQFLSQLSFS